VLNTSCYSVISCLFLASGIAVYKPIWEFRICWAVTQPIWGRYGKDRWTQSFTASNKTQTFTFSWYHWKVLWTILVHLYWEFRQVGV